MSFLQRNRSEYKCIHSFWNNVNMVCDFTCVAGFVACLVRVMMYVYVVSSIYHYNLWFNWELRFLFPRIYKIDSKLCLVGNVDIKFSAQIRSIPKCLNAI